MSDIKLTAKYRMTGNYGKIFVVCSVSVLAALLCSCLPLFSRWLMSPEAVVSALGGQGSALYVSLSAAAALLCALLAISVSACFRMWREQRQYCTAGYRSCPRLTSFFRISKMLRCVRCYVYSVGLHLTRFILFELPCVAVCAAVGYCVTSTALTPSVFAAMCICAAVLFLVGCIFTLILNGGELLLYYIVIESPDVSVRDAAKKSRQLTRGQLLKIARFKLGFSGWFILCWLVIPAFYVWGYYKQSLAVLAQRNRKLLILSPK